MLPFKSCYSISKVKSSFIYRMFTLRFAGLLCRVMWSNQSQQTCSSFNQSGTRTKPIVTVTWLAVLQLQLIFIFDIGQIFPNTRFPNIANDQWSPTLYFVLWTVENGFQESRQSVFKRGFLVRNAPPEKYLISRITHSHITHHAFGHNASSFREPNEKKKRLLFQRSIFHFDKICFSLGDIISGTYECSFSRSFQFLSFIAKAQWLVMNPQESERNEIENRCLDWKYSV